MAEDGSGAASPKRKRTRIALSKNYTDEGIAAELVSLLQTVTADGVVTDAEAEQLRWWLDDNKDSGLPAINFLRATVQQILADGKVTDIERRELHRAVERVLPPELRQDAKAKRTATEAAVKVSERIARESAREQQRREREANRAVASANFMVAGVLYDGRAQVVSRHATVGQSVFLAREPSNEYDQNAIRIRLANGLDIGFMPREDAAQFAPLLDAGCLQEAYLTKILAGRRAPIPVVQAYLYRPGAAVPNAIDDSAVPAQTSRPSPSRTDQAQQAGCSGFLIAIAGCALLALLVVFGLSR